MPLTSSQISAFIFCPHSWYLTQTQGFKPTESSTKGEQYHQTISQNQTKAKLLHLLIRITIIVIIILSIYKVLR